MQLSKVMERLDTLTKRVEVLEAKNAQLQGQVYHCGPGSKLNPIEVDDLSSELYYTTPDKESTLVTEPVMVLPAVSG